MKVVEIPVPMWGSWTTCTPLGMRSPARSESSGSDIESPVTSSVCSATLGGARAPIVAGGKAAGVTVEACAPLVTAANPGPLSAGSGLRNAVVVWAALASGSWPAIQLLG